MTAGQSGTRAATKPAVKVSCRPRGQMPLRWGQVPLAVSDELVTALLLSLRTSLAVRGCCWPAVRQKVSDGSAYQPRFPAALRRRESLRRLYQARVEKLIRRGSLYSSLLKLLFKHDKTRRPCDGAASPRSSFVSDEPNPDSVNWNASWRLRRFV